MRVLSKVGRYLYSNKSQTETDVLPLGDQSMAQQNEITVNDTSGPPAVAEVAEPSSSGYDGPDTSSFSAFLLSLLSISHEAFGDASSMSDSSEELEMGVSDTYNWSKLGLGLNFYKKNSKEEAGASPEGPEDAKPERSSYFYSGNWIGTNFLFGSKTTSTTGSPFKGADVSPLASATENSGTPKTPETPRTPRSPVKLPVMSEESFLLSDSCRMLIYAALPALAKGREWVLLYSTAKHGISLATLYRRSELATGPCLLVVGDSEGTRFGGLSSGPFKPSTKKKYQGTSDCFVFSDVSGETEIFKASGLNRYFVLCMNDALSMGGGGHFALQIDGELHSGSSGECETFRSKRLTKDDEFRIRQVELWGFAHTSRYTPKAAHWHEPEVVPGIHGL